MIAVLSAQLTALNVLGCFVQFLNKFIDYYETWYDFMPLKTTHRRNFFRYGLGALSPVSYVGGLTLVPCWASGIFVGKIAAVHVSPGGVRFSFISIFPPSLLLH